MDTTTAPGLAEATIATLRAHEAELRAAGILRLSLFGSVARGDHDAESDIDLVAVLDREKELDLVDLIRLEDCLAKLVDRKVDLVPEPVEKPRLRVNIERDRRHVF